MRNPAEFVGTPYASYNCFALVRLVAKECYGLMFPTVERNSQDTQKEVREGLQDPRWVEIESGNEMAGDLVTLSPTKDNAGHVGILLQGGWVLHNDRKYGCIIQDYNGLRTRGYIYRKWYRWTP